MDEVKPVKSGKVNVDGVNLYYELYGQGDPLVLVAGTGISLAPWPITGQPLGDLGEGMGGHGGEDAAEEVEVLLPRAVVNVLPLAAPQLDRLVIEEPDTRE
jgi:hypothetical protein